MKNQRGFTLIELLVVIAIIGILAGMVIVSLGGAREKARDAQRKSDLGQMKSALELYASDNQAYPTKAQCTAISTMTAEFQPQGGTAYIRTIPKDPKTGQNGYPDYCYISANGTNYVMWAKLENGNDPDRYQANVKVPADNSAPPASIGAPAYFVQNS